MAGLFRAYGQLRRGSGAWRTPFLIPLGDIVPPFIQGSSNVAIDAGATHPDLRIGLVITSIDHYPTIGVQFHVKPQPGSVLTDITLRMVLLMTDGSGHEPSFVDGGALGTAAKFAVLHYRVPPGRTLPDDVAIDLLSDYDNRDPNDTSPNPPNLTAAQMAALAASGKPAIRVDRVVLAVQPDPLDVAGGMVTGPMVNLAGVETDYNSLLSTNYTETARQIHGIDLSWLESPLAPKPPSATWLSATATGGHQLRVEIDTPTVGTAPPGAPTVAATAAAGNLRPGTYRYCTTWLHANGNESAASDHSAPVRATATDRSVHVSGLPAAPAPPSPDLTGIAVVKRRLYRTDCDTSVDPADPVRGSRGDDVLVAELPLTTTSFDDAGPPDPSAAQPTRSDYMAILYTSPSRMDITGSIRMISGPADDTYGGSVTSAPKTLRVLYRPGADTKLLWTADDSTPRVEVQMPGFSTPYGTGLFATAEAVPRHFALDWSILGSEFFGLAVAGDTTTVKPAGADPAEPIGRVGLRFGPTAPPVGWPHGDADVAAELADAASGAAGGLVALTGLRRGVVRSGGRLWSERDAERGAIDIGALFAAPADAHHDRTLRFARRSGPNDVAPVLAFEGHFLPDVVHARAQFPDVGSPTLLLDSRVRFLRAQVVAHLFAKADPAHPEVPPALTGVLDGLAFLDDTTDRLEATLAASPKVTAKWPVRLAGTLHMRDADGAPATTTVWPDVIVPGEVTVVPDWPMGADLAEPGVSGRVAVGFGDEVPLAVRATPQLKVLTNGDAELSPGMRALTARVLSVASAEIPKSLTQFGSRGQGTGTVDVEPVLKFHDRANSSLRAEVIEREHRVAHEVDLRAPAGARSWLRARTAHVPQVLTPMVRLVDGSPIGAELVVSEPWGAGVVWAEPSYVWVPPLPPPKPAAGAESDLSKDQGIGLATVGWDGIPARLEGWLISDTPALDGKVDTADRLPDVGPATSSWVPGGVVLRVDGPVRLSGLQLALRTGASRVCWNDNTSGGFGTGVILEPDHPVRHGDWIEAVAPFVELVPASAGIRDVIVWSAKSFEPPPPPDPPPDPPPEEPNPCSGSKGPTGPKTALGWHVHDEMRIKAALKYYDLVTPSGPQDPAPRWWSMPRTSERWGGDDVATGEWQLRYELQMDDYGMAKVAVYPDLDLLGSPNVRDNPFGDWQGGNGKYWIRARTVDFWWVFHCDIYIGNVGGGTSIPFTNAIYSTLPRIFNWSYP